MVDSKRENELLDALLDLSDDDFQSWLDKQPDKEDLAKHAVALVGSKSPEQVREEQAAREKELGNPEDADGADGDDDAEDEEDGED